MSGRHTVHLEVFCVLFYALQTYVTYMMLSYQLLMLWIANGYTVLLLPLA